jgi:hypothetical protein
MASVEQITYNAPDGATMGQSATELISFYGATPVAQLAGTSQGAVTMSATSTTTQLRTDVNKVATLANKIRANLVTLGLIKGAA